MATKKYISLSNLTSFFNNLKDLFATKTEMSTKSDKTHTHAISDVTSLQSALNNKANSSHGTHVSYSSTSPLMDGTASVGTASTVARSDHKHPTDTSRAAQTSLDSHISNTTAHITSSERTNWNTGYTHSQSSHAPSNAEKNQNAFSNVVVGSTTIAADTATDTITLVAGDNITITPESTTDKITISAKDTTYSLSSFGITSTAAELNKLDGVTATATEINYIDGVTSNIQTQLDNKAAKSHTHTAANITDLTATVTELNYMDGVTSSVQAQLDGKASSGHTHSYAGSSSSGGAATSANKLNTNAGSATQPVYFKDGVPVETSYTLGKSVPSNAIFTDSHYSSKNVVGATNATSNTATALTNGNVYLNSVENGAVTSSHKISGSGATTVTTDASGNIVISSTDNNTTYNAAGSALGLVKSGGDATISNGVITVNDDSHNHTIANVDNLQASLDAKSNTSHTHNYAGSSSVGGSANSSVKLQTARTITLGTGATGTATSFDGTSNIAIPVTDVKESYLSWGGKNLVGSVSPIGASLSSEHSANRLAYLNPAAVKVEYSNDAGSTWTDSGLGNSAKINFVTTSSSIGVGSNSTVTTNHRTRVTLTAQNGTTGYVYTKPRKMLINVSTAGHGLTVTIEAKTGVSGASWVALGTYDLNGWSGWNDIPMTISTFGGGTTQTGNYWYMRLTFATTSINSNYTTTKSSIVGMRLFGDTCWTRTSNMGETGHLYSYDANQNATFPADVKATSFTENGTILSNKYAAKSHTHNAPDWNQNSSSAIDYIKNKTHWTSKGTNIIISQTTQQSVRKVKTGTNSWQPEYNYNNKYVVTVDGVQYQCVPYELDDGHGTTCFTLGDSRLRETPNNSHPEDVPFLVQAYVEDDGANGETNYHYWLFSHSTSGAHTIEIAEAEYHALDDRFIPNTIPRKIAGIIHQYAGTTAPDGYILCDGSYYRTDEYPELFNAIGFTYGESGSGVNLMFAVPNLATRVPIGVGSGYGLGSTGGEASHALTVNEMPKHDHGAVYTGNATAANKKYAWYTTVGDKIGYQVMETGSGTAHNNMQPYIALNYIISTGK